MTVEVHGTYLTADDQSPASGRVSFTPHIIAVHDESDPAHVVVQYAVTTPLDETGTFTTELIASDDPGWRTDADMPYLVCVNVDGYQTEFSVLIYGPGPVDLNDLLPLAESPGVGVVPIPGPQGPQGEVHVGSTVTLPAGTPATVVDTDPDPGVAVLDFGIPQGLKGDTGAQGVKGDKGDKGDQGIPGVQGPPGDLTKPVADARYHKNLLTTAQWWVDAGNVSADGLSLTDLSGQNRPAVFGTATQKPTVLPYAGRAYWHEPDPKAASGTGASIVGGGLPVANTSVQFVINGTLTHRTDQPASQAVQYGDGVNNWLIYCSSAGVVSSRVYIGGAITSVQIKASGGFSTKAWHRFTYTKVTGAVTYEDSDDGTTWTQIGSGTNNVNANPLPANCYLGSASAYQSVPGTRYYASVTVDGVKVGEFDPKNVNATYTQVANTGSAGGNWTFTRATATTAPRGVIVDRPIVLFGGGQKADVAGYRPNGDSVPLTVLVAVRDFSATADVSYQITATSVIGGAAAPGWAIYKNGGSNAEYVRAKDGTTNNSAPVNVILPIIGTAAGVISKASISPYFNGVKGTQVSTALTTTSPDADLGLGHTGASYASFEFLAAAVFERQLTDAEIAQASAELMGQQYPGTDANGNMSIVGNYTEGKAPSAINHVPRLARVPNPATGDLGMPGYYGSDTGVRSVTGGTIRRVGAVVTKSPGVTATTGFLDSEGAGGNTYLTRDAWPASLPGTAVTSPISWP